MLTADDPRHGERRGYRAGCRCERCTAANTKAHKLYLLGRCPKLIDPTGTRRRIRALLAIGWTYREISLACGRKSTNWSHELIRGGPRIRADVAAEVAAAYERMSMTIPVGPLRDRGRKEAARKGWAPPLAWTNIDDPHEQPAIGADKNPGGGLPWPELLAEYEFFTEQYGYSRADAVARMGITVDALEKAEKKRREADLRDRERPTEGAA